MPTEYRVEEMRREVRRHWIERLGAEFEHVCYAHRVKLRRPVIALDASASHWGRWDPVTRTLTLSVALIEQHPWDRVLEVLKHEMAHQYVTDLTAGEQPHGAEFHDACERFGVAAWARRAEIDLEKPPLEEVRGPALPDSEERLLKRVEKLLALATSSQEHEAALAMQKVQELYAKYNIERLRSRRAEALTYLTISLRRKRVEQHHWTVCSILNDHFFVRVIHSSLYDARDLCEYKAIELLGTRENVLMAEYVYHFLCNQLDRLWRSYRAREGKGRGLRARMSYFLGVLCGFREKLDGAEREREKAAREGCGTALIVPRDRELERFVDFRYPRLVTVRGGRRRYDSRSYEAGHNEGTRLVLHKGISEQQGNRGRLLKEWRDT